MPMKPPGSAKALIAGSLTRKKLKDRLPSWARLDSRSPSGLKVFADLRVVHDLAGFAQPAHDHAPEPVLVLQAER